MCGRLVQLKIKSYVTSNGRLPDNVLIKRCDFFRKEEKNYHEKFKLNKCNGQHEHFMLQNSDIDNLLFEQFKPYIGEFDIGSVEEDIERLQYELKETLDSIKNEHF